MRPDAERLNGQMAAIKALLLDGRPVVRRNAGPSMAELRRIRTLWLDDYYEIYRAHFYGENAATLARCMANNAHTTTRNVPSELPRDYLQMLGKQEGSKESWFKYLYTELPPNRQQEVYFKAFDIFGLPLSLDAFIPNDADLLQLLTDMLGWGLVAYDRQQEGVALVRTSTLNRYLTAQQHPVVPLAFRGETRSPAQKRDPDNGSRAKVLIPLFQNSLNMGAAWNPFRSEDVRQNCYFRRNNQDNCLYTAVSIAPEFQDASKFPLIQEPFTKKCGRARMRRANGQFVDNVAVSLTYVYLFKFTHGYDTRELQEQVYNERATRNVPYLNFLAWVPVLRFHYNEHSGNYGHLAWLPKRADDNFPGDPEMWLIGPFRRPDGLEAALDHLGGVEFIDCAMGDVVPAQERFDRICSIVWTEPLTLAFQANRVPNYAALQNVNNRDVVTAAPFP